jgi:hypothetical protein
MSRRRVVAPARVGRWWDRAACVGLNPEWWSGDRTTGSLAVEICLTCPVREPCLDEALAVGDCGVIRGAMLLVKPSRGKRTISLVCSHCHEAPVMATPSGYARHCSPACRLAASSSRLARAGAGW